MQFPEVTVHQFKTTLIHFYLTVPIRKKNLFLLVFIKEKSPSVPLKPTARHQVRPLHFWLAGGKLQSPGHSPVSIYIWVLMKIMWFSVNTNSPCFSSQIKYFPSPSWAPIFVSLQLLLPSEWDSGEAENVHCTENVRPTSGLGKQSLHWAVVCLAVLLCQNITLSNFFFFFFFGDVCQANYPYCKLKVKVLVLILLCVTVCFFETAFLVSENRILLVIPS